MAALRVKMLGSALLGLLAAIVVVSMIAPPLRVPAPGPRPAPVEEPAAPPIAESEPDPIGSRSRGQSEWAFFFRAGDTLSRMKDGTLLGEVLRLERQHRFPDGSTGPAYVVRSPDQSERVFDADELERRARIEAIRDAWVPPTRRPDAATTR